MSARLLPLVLTACGWPTVSNLPEPCPSKDCLHATVDPRSLVSADFSQASEVEPNDDIDGAPAFVGDLGLGVVISASLDGTGWDNGAPADVLCASCPEGSVVLEHPAGGGAYSADRDWFGVQVRDPGTLCVSVRAEAAQDVFADVLVATRSAGQLIFEVDGDGIPVGLGQSLADDVEWALPVGVGDETLVLIGAYEPNDPNRTLDYRIGVSLVEGDVQLAGCPLPFR